MKKTILGVCIALTMLLITGCAKRGFDRGELKASMYAGQKVTEEEIRHVMDLKPQITFPFKLGVYFPWAYTRWYGNKKWAKDEKDLNWLEPLKQEGIVSEIIPITSLTVQKESEDGFLKSIRLAAARHNADAVLIIDYNHSIDRYHNYLSFLYLTIVGGYLIPGTHSDALVMMNGALWDVRNEYLYMTAEVEAEAHKIGAAFVLNDEDSIHQAKRQAFESFKAEILQRIRHLKAIPPAWADQSPNN